MCVIQEANSFASVLLLFEILFGFFFSEFCGSRVFLLVVFFLVEVPPLPDPDPVADAGDLAVVQRLQHRAGQAVAETQTAPRSRDLLTSFKGKWAIDNFPHSPNWLF